MTINYTEYSRVCRSYLSIEGGKHDIYDCGEYTVYLRNDQELSFNQYSQELVVAKTPVANTVYKIGAYDVPQHTYYLQPYNNYDVQDVLENRQPILDEKNFQEINSTQPYLAVSEYFYNTRVKH